MLDSLYQDWNSKINVISRKDMDQFYTRHVLHSLAIAKIIDFAPGTRIIDFGCGGGFPGVPLAIMFPEVEFHLADSITKKIKVVKEVSRELKLDNLTAHNVRVENMPLKADFLTCRAVARFSKLLPWIKGKTLASENNSLSNGLIALKGMPLDEEIAELSVKPQSWQIKDFFDDEFFETKAVYHLKV